MQIPTAPSEELDALVSFMRRYVVATQEQFDVVALWVAFCYTVEAFSVAPYLHITAPTPRAGKTRLLEVLEVLLPRPWLTSRVTPAALVRKIQANSGVTLLLDEGDASFGQGRGSSEALRGILNSGYRRSGTYSVCERGVGGGLSVRDFRTFGPKAIAGIGRLPGTLQDRSIPIELRRRHQDQMIAAFREAEARLDAKPVRERLSYWAGQSKDHLRKARPDVPLLESDRAMEVIEPLIAISDLAGGQWPERARHATVHLMGTKAPDSIPGLVVLSTIRQAFKDAGDPDVLSTAEIIHSIRSVESLSTTAGPRRELSAKRLGDILSPFGVHPSGPFEFKGRKKRGYRRAAFLDAWERYVDNVTVLAENDDQDDGNYASTDRREDA